MSSRKVIQVSSKYTTKDGAEKWRNANVGSAFTRDNGEISLMLDPGISIASLEGVRITIREPFDKDAPRQGGGGGGQRRESSQAGGYEGGGGGATDDDSIPFAPVGDIG